MRIRSFFHFALLLLVACSSETSADDAESANDAVSSNQATVVDFAFEGEVVVPRLHDTRIAAEKQVGYVHAALESSGRGSARVGAGVVSGIREVQDGETKRISYAATVPVAWKKGVELPNEYELVLPKNVGSTCDFQEKYVDRCGGWDGKRSSTCFLRWNPSADGCKLDEADIVRVKARVRASKLETTKKYPEYDQLWADNRLDVVAVFVSRGPSRTDTPEIRDAQRFIEAAKGMLVIPKIAEHEGHEGFISHRTLTGKVEVEMRMRDVKIDVLVTESLIVPPSQFMASYEALAPKADVVILDGREYEGWDANGLVRAGAVMPGKYQLFLFDGSETFAYLDDTITKRRIEANGAANDPHGTRFLDFVVNASRAADEDGAKMATGFLSAVLDYDDRPKHYNEILDALPSSQVVVVFGDEDNRFVP